MLFTERKYNHKLLKHKHGEAIYNTVYSIINNDNKLLSNTQQSRTALAMINTKILNTQVLPLLIYY